MVGFEGLSRMVLPLETRAALAALRAAYGEAEIVPVSTCNRIECYFSPPRGVPLPEPENLRRRVAEIFAASPENFFVKVGEEALEHLFRVVASLDSLVLGECEIAGQVRRAAERAKEAGLAGPAIRRIFERASVVARRVRSETAIGRTPVSVASLCNRRIREHFGDALPGSAVFVGVGDMTKKVAAALGERGARLLFVNRTVAKAEALAAEYGGSALSLERFLAAPPDEIDVLVTATSAPTLVIPRTALLPALAKRRATASPPLLICDLGVPRDVDPALDREPGVRVLALPDLEAVARENRRRLEGEVGAACAIIAHEVARFAREQRSRALAEEGIDRLLAGRLRHLSPEDRETLRGFATGLADRLARQPGMGAPRPAGASG
jgi:glutamyl-tRNA reductase